ncbi:anti-sigma factor antagonist [Massilia sp. JS1662]|nr:STAS domain-containing protein [Massilia sp. JS1662]KGF79226.1 anti-sigma factor antagonist [Massilia sp. JS1662]
MMTKDDALQLSGLVRENMEAICADWQMAQPARAQAEQTRTQCGHFLQAYADALASGDFAHTDGRAWDDVRRVLDEVSASRASAGSSSSATATFIFSVKQPLFRLLRERFGAEPARLASLSWAAGVLIDQLGLYTLEVFQKSRDRIVARQQRELLELSTPVISLWEGIIALPLIGTLDSARALVVMENLLDKIVASGAHTAIIDITGVPTVDTLVAQHLLKTIAAARLMGAHCILSGIRPQIAQTIVHLGIDLDNVPTRATLAEAFTAALDRPGAA